MENKKNEIVSIIYSTRNDSPKHLVVEKRKFLFFIVTLPLITIISIALGIVGLIHTSPFHLIQNYQTNNEAREAIAQTQSLKNNLIYIKSENESLKKEIETLKSTSSTAATNLPESKNEEKTASTKTSENKLSCPPVTVCPTTPSAPMANSIGLSTLSFFKPVQMQKDKTRPASLSLSDFKVVNNRDNLNFQFNIINNLGGDVKLSGHIIVLMKNETMIEVYPMNALSTSRDHQINYASGEPFATQRFRPVDASFPKPKKGGNYVFTIYIFAKNGDLIHYQAVTLPVKF